MEKMTETSETDVSVLTGVTVVSEGEIRTDPSPVNGVSPSSIGCEMPTSEMCISVPADSGAFVNPPRTVLHGKSVHPHLL